MTLRLGYLTGEYPRATDTFIQREVAMLREQGATVETFSVRRTASEHFVGEEQKAERDRTFYILDNAKKPLRLLVDHAACLFTAPGRYLSTLSLAWKTRFPGIKGTLYQFFYFAEAAVLARQMKAKDLQHLHNHFADSSCSLAMLASSMAGLSYSFTLHGPMIFFAPERWQLGEKIRRASFVAAISHFARSQGMIFVERQHWDKMHIIHCGVEPEKFSLRRHEGHGRRLIYVGRLADVKGIGVLLEALAMIKRKFPQVTLDIVGDGPDRASLETRANELGLSENVIFHGYRSQAQVREHFADADVFVMSSFAEGVPVVLMEALGAGVPAVATRIAGIGELVEDGINGLIVPPGDVHALANKVAALLGDADMRNRFGEAGRSKVMEHYNVRLEAQRLHTVFSHYLEGTALPSEISRFEKLDLPSSNDAGSTEPTMHKGVA